MKPHIKEEIDQAMSDFNESHSDFHLGFASGTISRAFKQFELTVAEFCALNDTLRGMIQHTKPIKLI